MASPEYTFETATGRGSVHDVPGDLRLDTLFESYLVPVDDGHIHAVIGDWAAPCCCSRAGRKTGSPSVI